MNCLRNRPEMMMLFYLCTLLLSCKAGEKEALIVSRNFKGYILIIYNQKNGFAPEYDNGKRVYTIPPDGICKSQLPSNEGVRDLSEFYYEKITSENRVPSYVDFDKIPRDVVVGFMGPRASANKDYEGKQTIEYSLYYVGTREEIKRAIAASEKIDVTTIAN